MKRSAAIVILAGAIGVAFGTAAIFFDTRDESAPTIVSVVMNAPFFWAAFGFLVGAATARARGTWWQAALAGLLALAGAVGAYYCLDVLWRENIDPALNAEDLRRWGLNSLFTGPALGFAGWLWVRTPAGALVAGLLLVGQLWVSALSVRNAVWMQVRDLHSDGEVEPITANGILIGASVVLLVLLGHHTYARLVRRREIRSATG